MDILQVRTRRSRKKHIGTSLDEINPINDDAYAKRKE